MYDKTFRVKVSNCPSEISGATEAELVGREQSHKGAVSASCFHLFGTRCQWHSGWLPFQFITARRSPAA